MAGTSKIEWTDHTFNPWWGCAKVSPGCDNCYAERDAGRYTPDRKLWGVDAERREFGDKHWNEPLKWDRAAMVAGKRARVFCASMADVFDKNSPRGARERLWGRIRQTPNLDWQLLTKRIGNVPKMLPDDWGDGYPNVWVGISIVNRPEMLRDATKLRDIPARVRFWSYEPALGYLGTIPRELMPDWVIVGGESGPKARPFEVDWAESVAMQCRDAGVACFVKQLGANVMDHNDVGFDADEVTDTETGEPFNRRAWPSDTVTEDHPNGYREEYQGAPIRIWLKDRKGGDMAEWPHALRVREFPQ